MFASLHFVNTGQDEENFPIQIAKLKAYLSHLQTHKSETLDDFSSSSDSVIVSKTQGLQQTNQNPIMTTPMNTDATTLAPAPSALDALVQALWSLTANTSKMTKAQFAALDQNAVRDFVLQHYVGAIHLTARDRHQIFTLLAVTEPGNTLTVETRAHINQQMVLMYYVVRHNWATATAFCKDVVESNAYDEIGISACQNKNDVHFTFY